MPCEPRRLVDVERQRPEWPRLAAPAALVEIEVSGAFKLRREVDLVMRTSFQMDSGWHRAEPVSVAAGRAQTRYQVPSTILAYQPICCQVSY